MSDRARWSRLLAKLDRAQCSPEELQELRALADVDPARVRILAQFLPWRAPGSEAQDHVADTMEQDLAAVLAAHRLDRASRQRTPLQPPIAKHMNRAPGAKGAFIGRPARYAALLMAVVAGSLLLRYGLARGSHIPQFTPTAYTAARGERRTVTLPDGSRAELAPETRLTFQIKGDARQLELVGEASFDVVHNAHRPFTVRAAGALTTDVGTRFVVRAYGSDSDVRVLVIEGAVALRRSAGGRSYRVTSGDLGVVAAAGSPRVLPAEPTDPLVLWSSRQLGFKRTPFRLAILDVGRWYNLDVRLADSSLADRLVSGTLPPASADDAIIALANVVGARWERRGSVVTFYAMVPRVCVRRTPPGDTGRCSAPEDSFAGH
jgi:transmembrane sensor